MPTSEDGKRFITREEGFRMDVYLDIKGIPTVGVGHKVLPVDNLNVGDSISYDRVLAFLENDLLGPEAAAEECGDFSQWELDALVCLIFNIGIGHFRSSTLRKKLLAEDESGAANEFLEWDVVDGKHNSALHSRRERERDLFLTGQYNLEPME